MCSDLELALLTFLNKERWKPGQRECVKRLMTRNEMFFRNTEPHGTAAGLPCGGGKNFMIHSCKYGCEWNQHYNCAIECKLSREIVHDNNYPIQKWNQPHESYIARAPKEVLERAMVGNGKPTDHTNHSGSHHSTIACIIGKGPPPCWPN